MRRQLLDILACPLDGASPLTLEGEGDEVIDGSLVCSECGAAYPIVDGIPHLVREGLRDDSKATDDDRALIEEGDYWARFLAEYVDRGDRSILDVRCKGTHPPFLHMGVAELDDRDTRREMGMWPSHLARPIQEWIKEGDRSGWILDVGCGGGQFGLEPAYAGWNVVGVDVSLGSLLIARKHTREVGVAIDHVYADPAQPPFRKGAFDRLIGKDSLHHLVNVGEVVKGLSSLLKDDGRVLFYEHVGGSRVVERLRGALARWLVPKILRGYPPETIPEIFKSGSRHEDAGRDRTLPALRNAFETERLIGEMFFYYEVEDLVYFASGKNERLARFCFETTYRLERLLLLVAKPDHVTFFGRKR